MGKPDVSCSFKKKKVYNLDLMVFLIVTRAEKEKQAR